MDQGTGMRLRKVCRQCSTVIHARRSVCECGHAFTLKKEARITASSPAKCKRALESLEDTMRTDVLHKVFSSDYSYISFGGILSSFLQTDFDYI